MKRILILSAVLLGAATASQAGVRVGIGINIPFFSTPHACAVQPAPVVVAPAPCVAPAPVVVAPVTYVAPAPVFVAPARVVVGVGFGSVYVGGYHPVYHGHYYYGHSRYWHR